ncbi:MAG: glycerol-3-phosphate acyltransferase [Clostridia bacterium]|nr:glycerol-3-phosphate acyltransferase [Clostridia bacterium]
MYTLKVVASILIGYLLGTISPAALISKFKHMNLRKKGTGNLGATNVMLNFGKRYGVLVMLFDMAKALVAVKLVQLIFSDMILGLIAGVAAIVGHIFPIYMRFKGGKGLACFAGLVLAYDPWIFLILLILTVVLIIIINYTFAMPYSAGILFPVMSLVKSGDLRVFFLTAIASALIMYKHYENVVKARNGTDTKIREFIRTKLFKKTTDK